MGRGPFSWDVSNEAYDGKADRLLQIEVGTPNNHQKIMQRVEVRDARPVRYDTFDSGWSLSAFGARFLPFGGGISEGLATMRLAVAMGRIKLDISKGSFDGSECLILTITQYDQVWTYFFDSARECALRGIESRTTAAGSPSRTTVKKLIEAAPGVFYPTEAVSELVIPGQGEYRCTFNASSVVANDAHFDPSIFTILPRGVPVYEMDKDGILKRVANSRVAGSAGADCNILSGGVLAGVEGSSLEVNERPVCRDSSAFEARSFDSSEYASAQDRGAGDPPNLSRAHAN